MRTILIVEDTDFCRDALEVALMGVEGVELQTVATAEAALECLARQDICAIVTDLRLVASPPGAMDGFEFIAAIRAQPERAALPVLVVSGDSDPHTPARLRGLGADAFFPKPYSPTAVRGKLEQLIHEYNHAGYNHAAFNGKDGENA